MPVKYTEEMLREAVAASVSFAAVVRYLGLVETGGNHTHIARRIRALGLDTSHFTGRSWARGTSRPRRKPEEVLIEYPVGAPRINGGRLRSLSCAPDGVTSARGAATAVCG